VAARCAVACFLPCRSLGVQAGAVQSGNIALLGALCALGALPFGKDVVAETIRATMKPKVAEINLKALDLGAACPA
jgi:indolepyruvate ferredoxin oxidoreductase, beta subunit